MDLASRVVGLGMIAAGLYVALPALVEVSRGSGAKEPFRAGE